MMFKFVRTFIIISLILIISKANINTVYPLNNISEYEEPFNNSKKYSCEEGYKYILNNCVKIRNINKYDYFNLHITDYILILFTIIIGIYK
jgi:hypothetical protein